MRSLRVLLIGFVAVINTPIAKGQLVPDESGKVRDRWVDMIRMDLDVELKPVERKVVGEVKYDMLCMRTRVDSLFLDGPRIEITEATVDAKAVTWRSNDNGVWIYFRPGLTKKVDKKGNAATYSLKLKYNASPKRGIYFVGYDDPTGRSRKQIWTQGQGIDNRHWIPGWDDPGDKLITAVKLRVPEGMNLLSNGPLVKKTQKKGQLWSYEYAMSKPHSFYLIMVGAGDYAVATSTSKGGVKMEKWYYPDKPEWLEPTYRYTEQIMDILEQETGIKYPWEKYAQIPVQDFLYGAMENTTATVFGDFFCADERGYRDRKYVEVNAHEMAHQWFGDLVSAKSYTDQWLQESFATYYAKLCEERLFGNAYKQWNQYQEMQRAIGADTKDMLPIKHGRAGSPRIYQKGSVVLDMLKYVMGEEDYNAGVKGYLQDFAYGNVTTFDFYNSLHKHTGQNLDWFFDQWIYKAGMPKLSVRFESLEAPSQVRMDIEQTQDISDVVGYFKMPLVVEIHYKSGKIELVKGWMEGHKTSLVWDKPKGQEVDFVVLDPGNRILKEMTFARTDAQLLRQAELAQQPIDRYLAWVALRNTASDKKMALMQKAIKGEPSFPYCAVEIIKYHLTPANTTEAIVLQALQSSDDKITQAMLTRPDLLAVVKEDSKIAVLLKDSSYTTIELALNYLDEFRKEGLMSHLDAVKDVYGNGGNVRIAYLRASYAVQGATALDELADMCGPSYEFRTRMNAMQALVQLNQLNNKAIDNMLQATTSWNGRLAGPTREMLAQFMKQKQTKALIRTRLESEQWKGKKEVDAVRGMLIAK